MIHKESDWEQVIPHLDTNDTDAVEIHVGLYSNILCDGQHLEQCLKEWLKEISQTIIHLHHNGNTMFTENVKRLVNENKLLLLITKEAWVIWPRYNLVIDGKNMIAYGIYMFHHT